MAVLSDQLKTILQRLTESKDEINKKYDITNIPHIEKLTFDELPPAIEKIDCLGSINNQETFNIHDILDSNHTICEIPNGYSDGTSDVRINPQEKTVMPSLSPQVIFPDEKHVITKVLVEGDNNLLPENIKEGVTIFGVQGTHKDNDSTKKPDDIKRPELNIDTNDDGIPDLNIDTNGDGIPDLNIDYNNDGIPEFNIDTDGDGIPDLNLINQDTDGDGIPDLNVDDNYDGIPDRNIDINGDGIPDLNIDLDNDKVPDINIDTNKDGIPDKNIDWNNNNIPDINVDYNINGIPNKDINIDTDGDGIPDLNVDTTGDGIPNLNIDVNGNYVPDFNVDTTGDGIADSNIVNKDTTGDGIPNLNIDINNDGKPDLNIDWNNDNIPDTNIDTNGDGKSDLNIDRNNDGIPDTNIDTTGDGVPDKNIIDKNNKLWNDTHNNGSVLHYSFARGTTWKPLNEYMEVQNKDSKFNGKFRFSSNYGLNHFINATDNLYDGAKIACTGMSENGNFNGISPECNNPDAWNAYGEMEYIKVNVIKNKDKISFCCSKYCKSLDEARMSPLKNDYEIALDLNTIYKKGVKINKDITRERDVNLKDFINRPTRIGISTSLSIRPHFWDIRVINLDTGETKNYLNGKSIKEIQDLINNQVTHKFYNDLKAFVNHNASGETYWEACDADNGIRAYTQKLGYSVLYFDELENFEFQTIIAGSIFNDNVGLSGIILSVGPLEPNNNINSEGNILDDNGNLISSIINKDINGDGIPDLNIDMDGNGIADINIDTNGDGIADVNIDINGDRKPNVNIDTDGDGKPDINIDTNGDGIPDANIDTDNDGVADSNIITNILKPHPNPPTNNQEKDEEYEFPDVNDRIISDNLKENIIQIETKDNDAILHPEKYINSQEGDNICIDDNLTWTNPGDKIRKDSNDCEGSLFKQWWTTDSVYRIDGTKYSCATSNITDPDTNKTYNDTLAYPNVYSGPSNSFKVYPMKNSEIVDAYQDFGFTSRYYTNDKKLYHYGEQRYPNYKEIYNSYTGKSILRKMTYIESGWPNEIPELEKYGFGYSSRASHLYKIFQRVFKTNGEVNTFVYNYLYNKPFAEFPKVNLNGQEYIQINVTSLRVPTWLCDQIYRAAFYDFCSYLPKWQWPIYTIIPDETVDYYCDDPIVEHIYLGFYEENFRQKCLQEIEDTFQDIVKTVKSTYPDLPYKDGFECTKQLGDGRWRLTYENVIDKLCEYTEEEKVKIAKVIHDYLVINNVYEFSDMDQTLYAAMSKGKVGPVCTSYALAFKYCCERFGILCHIVLGCVGEDDDGTMYGNKHMWNRVCYLPVKTTKNGSTYNLLEYELKPNNEVISMYKEILQIIDPDNIDKYFIDTNKYHNDWEAGQGVKFEPELTKFISLTPRQQFGNAYPLFDRQYWYEVDVCWDDPETEENSFVGDTKNLNWDYFNISSSKICSQFGGNRKYSSWGITHDGIECYANYLGQDSYGSQQLSNDRKSTNHEYTGNKIFSM